MFDAAQLTQIEAKLDLLLTKVGSLMSVETDLQADMDAIKAGVATVLAAQQAQAATIAQLTAQLAAGTPVTQAQLDALDAVRSSSAVKPKRLSRV
jgi:hypothetical protein